MNLYNIFYQCGKAIWISWYINISTTMTEHMNTHIYIYPGNLGKLQYFTNLNEGHLGMIPLTNHDSRARSQ